MLAIACSIAIHEIIIGAGGFLRMAREPEREQPVQATRVVIELRSPEPTPTVAPSSRVALVQSVAAPRATFLAVHTGGSKGGPKLEVHTQKIVHHKESLPSWWSAMHGSKTVASLGTGTVTTPAPGASSGSGTGSGSGAGSGSNNGGGTGGNGNGVANTTAPCGSPYFFRVHSEHTKDGGVDDTIRVQLTLGSGQQLDGIFPYSWHYASAADDPFSKPPGDDDDVVPAKLPPRGFDVTTAPAAVRLTLAKTLPNGLTLFDPCPAGVGRDL